MFPKHLNQSDVLSTLTQVPAETIKAFTEPMLDELGSISVLKNRTGLIMLPYRDTAQGELFHLGEVLVSEAHVKLQEHNSEGYAACLGRDLEQALAVAILDASLSAKQLVDPITEFFQAEKQKLADADETLLKQVEATRVEMETF